LRVTNGFRRISPYIDEVWSTGAVRPFSLDNARWIAMHRDYPPVSDQEHRRYGDQQHCVAIDARYLWTAIQISEVDDGVLLLNPAVVTADGEWEAWFFASWLPGANRYPSFLELVRALQADSATAEPPGLN
jgi:hypothetical protein